MKSKLHLITHFKKEQKKTYMYIPLTLLIIITISLSILLISDLNWEDKITKQKGLQLFILGLIFFITFYQLLNNLFLRTTNGQRLMKLYKLTISDIYDISNKNVSAIQAIFCCLTGLIICLYSCKRNILLTSHYISEAYAWFGSAYFFYDIWSMYKVYTTQQLFIINNNTNSTTNKTTLITKLEKIYNYLKSNLVIVGHHLFIGSFGFLVITYLRGGLGDCFFGFVYLMEASTPFVSIRGILSKCGKKSTKLYVINGIVMLIVFFICRVAMFPCVIYLYAVSTHQSYIAAIKSLPIGCKISILILLLPQIYWFMLMLRGASQVILKKNNSNNVTTTITNNRKKGGKNYYY